MSNSLIDHIADLRKTLIHCIAAVIILYPAGFLFVPHCINLLVAWSFPVGMKLNYFSPMEVFILQLKLGGIISFIITFPYIIWHISNFLLPALYENERKVLKYVVFSSTFLFILGTAFCIGVMLPLIMRFSASFASSQLQPMLGLSNFINFCSLLILAFGLMFQFPLLVIVAVKFDIITPEALKNKRPYVIVLILILAAIFTPPDIISQLLLFMPTWILFEIGLLFASRIKNDKNISKKH
ncbi:MAG: twin-arginine translocase subunit TatC [Elusimicrobiota bacterium]|jgi:sec-independent protein translocase protein TatC|nr:twin-arginine translocase subunit TatC [Elusimicrobiota bacterium]